MKYIAYKTAQNDPNLPNGFITEHFETDQETLEGYNVVTLETFNILFQNNVPLMRQAEIAQGIRPVNPNATMIRPTNVVELVPDNFVPPAPANPDPNNAELFSQFLAWVAAGKPGSAPSNT